MSDATTHDLGFIDDGRTALARIRRRRLRIALSMSATVTLVWLVYVTASGQWDRVIANWEATVMMVFGSFVAGSTPQGSGAISFPVLTKGLAIPAEVARTFALSIQSVGMGTAALTILVSRRQIERRALLIVLPIASAAFLGTLWLLGDPTAPFWPMRVPGAYVKVTFTLVLAAMAFVVYLASRVRVREVRSTVPVINARVGIGLVIAAVVGGLLVAMIGSGADVMFYLLVVVLLRVDPKVGVPTSVILMAAMSLVGLLVLGVGDGQLDVTISNGGGAVTAVGGQAVAQGPNGAVFGSGARLPAARWDLFGLWLASVPVVCWFAPLGAYVAGRIRARTLVVFVAVLALAEVASTAIFLTELRSDPWLLTYAICGLVVAVTLLWLAARHRRRLFALPALDRERTLTRADLDVAVGYQDDLVGEAPRRGRR